MSRAEFIERQLPDGRVLGLQPQIFNWRLYVLAHPGDMVILDDW